MAGEILPTGGASGFPMPGRPSSASTAAAPASSAPSFSAFSGKGKSIGGAVASAPSVPQSMSSEESQQQATAEAATRNIAAQSKLLQQIQEKREKAKCDKEEAFLQEDVGHAMNPDGQPTKADDNSGTMYAMVDGDNADEEAGER